MQISTELMSALIASGMTEAEAEAMISRSAKPEPTVKGGYSGSGGQSASCK